MKESYSNDTVAQKEALVNELKGSLFEYLVAQELSKELGVYHSFIHEFSKDIEKKHQLQQYESWTRDYDVILYKNLPLLAQQTCQDILKYLNQAVSNFKTLNAKNILLTGKFFSGDQKSSQESNSEADIILIDKQKKILPISLKLCKSGSYVNSKSAGVSSFLEKYFSQCLLADFFQQELILALEESFQHMGEACYQSIGLDFPGSFDHQWVDAGMTELPGQLPSHLKEVVHQSYEPVIKTIHRAFHHFFNKAPNDFIDSLATLVGFSEKNMLQVHCYHTGTGEYKFFESQIYSLNDLTITKELQIMELSPGKASFEVRMNHDILQIRVKPMNKFTSKSHKINCSFKRRGVAH